MTSATIKVFPPFVFDSPSAAAAVIHGGHVNGLRLWRDRQERTLKELESEGIADT